MLICEAMDVFINAMRKSFHSVLVYIYQIITLYDFICQLYLNKYKKEA